jgi:hypothetical protein
MVEKSLLGVCTMYDPIGSYEKGVKEVREKYAKIRQELSKKEKQDAGN